MKAQHSMEILQRLWIAMYEETKLESKSDYRSSVIDTYSRQARTLANQQTNRQSDRRAGKLADNQANWQTTRQITIFSAL